MTQAQREQRIAWADRAASQVHDAAHAAWRFTYLTRDDIDQALRHLTRLDRASARLRRHLVALRVAAGKGEGA